MTTASAKARINFLATSAYFYSSTAPATSAHLMQECNHFASDNNINLKETESNRACKACGTISIPGWTSRTTIIDAQKPKKSLLKSVKHKRPTAQEKRKQIVSLCLVCRRSIKISPKSLFKPSIRQKEHSQSQGVASSQLLMSESRTQETQSRSSENLNSKKRAKARKHGGLQAMLDKSRISQPGTSETGLDLMDFMKLS